MVQMVKCLLCKNEDLSLTSRTQVKQAPLETHCCNPSTGAGKTGGSLTSLANSSSLILILKIVRDFDTKWSCVGSVSENDS